jgi:predicted nucleic acid-binding protein
VTETAPPPVINTSPLIFLSKADLLSLLRVRYPTVLVPATVVQEIQQYGPLDPTTQTLKTTDWLTVVETPPLSPDLQACNLDAGEASVLAWAYAHPSTEAILDDLAGRRCAEKLGIPIRGTLGLVLAAKQQGHIPAAQPVIAKLRETGMYLSDRVVAKALALVGETL